MTSGTVTADTGTVTAGTECDRFAAHPARARDAIEFMAGYHSPQLDVDVRLNTNESPHPPPTALTDAVTKAVQHTVAWNRYPDRQAAELRSRIAQRHGVAPDCVFAANGSNEVLQCLLLAYGAAGRSATVFEPTYAMHGHLVRVTGTTPVYGKRLDDFSIDVDAAVDLISAARPSLTFLCSPNNPTGLVEATDTVTAVLEAVRSVGGLLCVDEAYGEFASNSAMDLLAADEECPLVVTRTYSKAWAMAALRLGYLVGPPWAVAALEKVALPYHLDSIKQVMGIAALDHDGAMRSRVAAIVDERERLVSKLTGFDVRVWPSGANFVLFRPRLHSGFEVWQALVDRSVLVRDCSSWPLFSDCLRVTVGTTEENDRFLSALAEVLA